MEVYFVRHGKTDGNVARRHQHRETALNQIGTAQAIAVAKKIKRLRPSYLITSTQVRAVQTARVIGNECDLIPETYPAFEELRRPHFLDGERMFSKVTILYIIRWFFGVEHASMHDGESYKAFHVRLGQARRQLEALPPTAKVVVVSHGVFIRFFAAAALHPKRLGFIAAACLLLRIITIKNTSITHLHFSRTAAKRGSGWQVVS